VSKISYPFKVLREIRAERHQYYPAYSAYWLPVNKTYYEAVGVEELHSGELLMPISVNESIYIPSEDKELCVTRIVHGEEGVVLCYVHGKYIKDETTIKQEKECRRLRDEQDRRDRECAKQDIPWWQFWK